MASKKSKEEKNQKPKGSEKPKNQQLIQMLSFRIVPAYFKEIEKVADKKNSVRLVVRTPGFHPGNRSSILLRATDFSVKVSTLQMLI